MISTESKEAFIMTKSNITCVILVKNEELNIRRCIESIKDLAERIVVVDSGSTDSTLDICHEYNCDVFYHEFENYGNQINWALDNTDIRTKWVYRIDADEVVTPELKEEILEKTKLHENDDVNGLIMKFNVYFLGKVLKHGGSSIYNLVIFKNGIGRYTDRMMGEHVELKEGNSEKLKHPCLHYDCKDLSTWINKHNWYSSREVIDYFERKQEGKKGDPNYYKVASRTASLRDKFYYKLPSFFRAHLFYIFRYYCKLGFLDGKAGKAYCYLQAYWYRFLVDAKLIEAKINKTKVTRNTGDLK